MKKKEELIHTEIKPNFVYPETNVRDFRFGSATEVESTILRPDGDWRDYLPEEELQSKNGVESSACFIEAQQHAIATIQEEQFDLPNKNYSARFNAYLTDGAGPSGGSPIAGADSIRHDGLIDEGMLPFSNDITSWSDFHSFKGANEPECRLKGKLWLEEWEPKYDIVIERFDSIEDKYKKLRESLTYGPTPISVTAWWEKDGIYYKPEGERDNHLVECAYLDEENHPYIWDTYPPFLKKLDKNYPFEFALRWSLKKREKVLIPVKKSFWSRLWDYIKDLFA